MRRKLTLLITTVVVALCLGHSAPAWSAEAAPYPVWWSPELGLESLDLIDSKLQEDFPRGQQFHLMKDELKGTKTDTLLDQAHPEYGYIYDYERVNIEERWIEDCRSLFEWTGKGFDVDQDDRYWVHAHNMRAIHSPRCYALLALKQVKPANTSYVRDFVFDQDAMSYIPPMIGMGWSCRGLHEFLEANRHGVSWSDFLSEFFGDKLPVYDRTVVDETTFLVEEILGRSPSYSGWVDHEFRTEIYGRGDINGDGLDDLLIRWQERNLAGNGDLFTRFTALYVATRYERDGVLRVVDFFGPLPKNSVGRCVARKYIVESGRSQ